MLKGLRQLPVHNVDMATPGDIVTNRDPIFAAANLLQICDRVSGAWPSANKPHASPFILNDTVTVYQLGWQNGSGTMGTNADVGIYDTSWNQLVAAGSTARVGASSIQFVDVADTVVGPGKYYLVATCSGTTAGNVGFWENGGIVLTLAGQGYFDSATNAHPLPNPLTNMVVNGTFVRTPILFMALRAAV